MAGPNEQVVREAVAAFRRGDTDALAQVLADDIVVHVPGSNQLSGEYKGKDDFLSGFVGKALSLTGGEFALEPHDILGSDEHAVGLYTLKATRDGRKFEWQHVNVYHVRDGKVAEVWQHPYDFEAWNAFWS